MEPNQRFAILTFPQYFDGKVLGVNVVFLPRNQNPLLSAIDGVPPLAGATPFADAKLSFVARIVSGLSGFPGSTPALPPVPLPAAHPTKARALFETLAHQFTISNLGVPNTNANVSLATHSAPLPTTLDKSVKKYLPHSYRKSFNFVAPRTRNAVTDDSYHCAVRAATPNPGFVPSPMEISWGQVFASAIRQPQLATALGMIYQTQITVDASHFPGGGWLYVDLADDSDYKAQLRVDDTLIKRYAARIPVLEIGKPRSVFGAIQFPVLAVVPKGDYDQIFLEAADYDDGFAKVVHAFQPVSHNLIQEQSDGFHPTQEIGIRLGWDDEQILIWYIRQLVEDPLVGAGERIDAPIGAFGYKIDVREDKQPPGPWESLNRVNSRAALTVVDPVTNGVVTLGKVIDKELPYQVYPAQLDGDLDKNYWLPMYFAAWAGKSMVLPDEDASALYQHGDVKANGDTHVSDRPKNGLNKVYESLGITTNLRYGDSYQFRIRLGDMSGGGPEFHHMPQDELLSQTTTCRFKRYVAPDTVRIDGLPNNTDEILFADTKLTLKRPLLGYPSVVFTGKYVTDPVALLQAASNAMLAKASRDQQAFGIADPDVDSVEILVELQTLKMDNMQSVSGRESYIKFYTTTRKFPTASKVFEDDLVVPLEYKDCKVLKFGDPGDLGDLGVNQAQLDALPQLILPRARTIRLTIRPVCQARPDYYGLEATDPAFNTRYGRTIQFQLRADPFADEKGLLSLARQVRGIFLQPDPPFLFDGNLGGLLLGKEVEKAPDMVQRLAQQLGVESKGLSLVAKKGQRVQFGCSHRIRHTLSPDNSIITFASKGDLAHHWLCCLMLDMDRDWTWDGLTDRSLVIDRTKHFKEDDVATETEKTPGIGDIEIKRTAPFTALIEPDRSHTTIIFIDAIEPKNERMQLPPHATEPRFPDVIHVEYTVRPAYKNPLHAATDDDYVLPLELPITTPPAQIPKIVSAGLALSPYVTKDSYSETEPRRRFLWIEFDEPVRDPKDTYFARVLSNAPDQLISNNSPELLVAPDESSLPVDAEYIRVITNNQPNDDAGLDAMQPMERSIGKDKDADRFYLLPLPSGLHPESAEMFGFFTYEIRVGHYRYTDKTPLHAKGDHVWTSAQGRFGRPLRVAGVQHPAPTLTCTVNRDEEKLYVTAPYAVAVHNGRNVTADPPRTEVWALLYAQVKQADGKEFRNVLLDDLVLSPNVRVEHDRTARWKWKYTAEERNTLKRTAVRWFKDDTTYTEFQHAFKLADSSTVNKDATKFGTTIWLNDDVTRMLAQYGLPADSALSVLCVEILPRITNVFDHVSALHKRDVREKMRAMMDSSNFPSDGAIAEELATRSIALKSIRFDEDRPLSDQLGHYRILRTSPLMKVPYVCCPSP
jgi:hypothetical protein